MYVIRYVIYFKRHGIAVVVRIESGFQSGNSQARLNQCLVGVQNELLYFIKWWIKRNHPVSKYQTYKKPLICSLKQNRLEFVLG